MFTSAFCEKLVNAVRQFLCMVLGDQVVFVSKIHSEVSFADKSKRGWGRGCFCFVVLLFVFFFNLDEPSYIFTWRALVHRCE